MWINNIGYIFGYKLQDDRFKINTDCIAILSNAKNPNNYKYKYTILYSINSSIFVRKYEFKEISVTAIGFGVNRYSILHLKTITYTNTMK